MQIACQKDENFADIDYSQILERAQLSKADADAALKKLVEAGAKAELK